MFSLISVTLAVFLSTANAKFPDNPKPCAFEDAACIQSLVGFLLSEKYNGYSALNMIPIDPLKIAAIDIIQGSESPVNIDLRFRNAEVIGLKTAQIVDIKGFGQDLTQQHEVNLKAGMLSLVGDYKVSGKILVLPVQGNGYSNITFLNTDVVLSFSGTPETKEDGTYLKIKKLRMRVDPQQVSFNLTRLFNGDHSMSHGLSSFVNENWDVIYREVRNSIESALGQVVKSVVNNVFQKYPYEKFFAQVSN